MDGDLFNLLDRFEPAWMVASVEGNSVEQIVLITLLQGHK